ncbi:hypothetical protein IGI04_040161 [Brassica rapa subsp. trilocularis]|uniref:Uncharacterized protein n=1 Tax=Brassica rapa subsp. trilocularis TaxID=1813537 RepID=A0ABQ7KPX5_BRACM|nr:hypothetical protein IGI04_040161 [Brassica rapa subsp. trilocularis]
MTHRDRHSWAVGYYTPTRTPNNSRTSSRENKESASWLIKLLPKHSSCFYDILTNPPIACVSFLDLDRLLQRHSSCFHDILTNPPIACVNFLDLDRVIGPLDKARTSSSAGLSRSSSSPLASWSMITSMAVRQHTQDVRVCPSAHTGRPVCPSAHTVCVRQHTQDVRVCPSAHTRRLWLSISTHISTLVLGLSTLALPVDCLGDFGPRGLYVQYTQDVRVRVCPVRVCPCVSVSTHRTSVAVHQYTYQHAGPWTQHVDPSRGFGTSVGVRQHSQDVLVCPSAHPGRTCVCQHTQDVAVRPWVSVSTPRTSVCVCQYTQDVRGCPPTHTGLSVVCCPVDCGLSVSVSTHRTSVAVRVCPSAHTRRPWLSISKHISTLILGLSTLDFPWTVWDVRGCPPAHTGRPWLSVAVRQHTQDVRGCLSKHTGRPWLSFSTHISTLVLGLSTLVLGLSTLALPVDCSCDFGPRGLSVHTHKTFVAVRVCPSAHTGRPWLSISTHISTLVLGISTLTLPVDCSGDFGPRGLSVQYTQDVRGCSPAHTGHPWLFTCVRLCPSAHTVHLTLALPVDCLGEFGPRGLSVQYTQDDCGCLPAHTGCPWLSVAVYGCLSAHTGRPWLSVCVRVCLWVSASTHRMSVAVHGRSSAHTGRLCVSVSTHRTSVCVRVCSSAHTGRMWRSISTHNSTLVLRLSTQALSVDCLGDFGPRGLSVQYTQDVRGCPPAHTGLHTRRSWLPINTHISTLVLGLSTLALPMDCSGDFGPRWLSVQYTQDVGGCPSAHPGRPCVSVSTHFTSVAVRVCPSAHTGRPWLSISTHISTLVLGVSTLTFPVDCSGDFGPCGLSVQYTQAICGCPPAQTGRFWLSVCVHVCPSVSVSTHRTSVAVHQYTYQHVAPWTQHAGPSRRLWVSASTHRTSVCVRVCQSAHTGHPWLSISTHISTLVHGLSTLALPVGCSGDFGPRGLSVQYTQDVRVCPSAHTGRSCVSVSTHRTSVGVCQHTHNVRGCPSVHISARWSFPWLILDNHRLSVDCRSVHIAAG